MVKLDNNSLGRVCGGQFQGADLALVNIFLRSRRAIDSYILDNLNIIENEVDPTIAFNNFYARITQKANAANVLFLTQNEIDSISNYLDFII